MFSEYYVGYFTKHWLALIIVLLRICFWKKKLICIIQEKPRNHLDMRHRLDSKGQRQGKLIDYRYRPTEFFYLLYQPHMSPLVMVLITACFLIFLQQSQRVKNCWTPGWALWKYARLHSWEGSLAFPFPFP